MNGNSNGCVIDGAGYVLTPSGAKVARVHDGRLWLYDKRTHEEVPFTLDDVTAMFEETQTVTTL